MRIAWATDVHLNFLSADDLTAFIARLGEARPDVVLLSGDIAEADSVLPHVAALVAAVPARFFYVLGNHDYYGGEIGKVRAAAHAAEVPRAVYLHDHAPVALDARTAVVGCDGWGDARLGDPDGSKVLLSDWSHIDDLAACSAMERRRARITKLRELGDESARVLAPALERALCEHAHVIVVTHVPPFAGATWHDGKISDDQWMPWFSCRATGDVIERLAAQHPEREITVVCGHTHGAGEFRPRANVVVRTGAAVYGAPALAGVWTEPAA